MTQGEHNDSVVKRLEKLELLVEHLFKQTDTSKPLSIKTQAKVAALVPNFPAQVPLKPLQNHPILDSLKAKVSTK